MKNHLDEITIQRCVDGELSDAHQCEFLAQLHTTEDWRTLALSFVENQTLGKAFVEQTPPVVQEISTQKASATHGLRRLAQPLTSVAAALLVGVLSGAGAHFWLRPPFDESSSISVADSGHHQIPLELVSTSVPTTAAPSSSSNLTPPAVAVSPDIVSTVSSQSSHSQSSPSLSASQPPRIDAHPHPMMNINLNGLRDGSAQPVTVPVFPIEQWEAHPHIQRGTVMPEEMRKQLEEMGYTIDREWKWYRASLEDGRDVYIPTENVRLRYAEQ